MRREGGERYRCDIPVGMRFHRRPEALEPLGQGRAVQAPGTFGQQARRERRDSLLARRLCRCTRLHDDDDGGDRQLGHRRHYQVHAVAHSLTLEPWEAVAARGRGHGTRGGGGPRCRHRRIALDGRTHGASAMASSFPGVAASASRGT